MRALGLKQPRGDTLQSWGGKSGEERGERKGSCSGDLMLTSVEFITSSSTMLLLVINSTVAVKVHANCRITPWAVF